MDVAMSGSEQHGVDRSRKERAIDPHRDVESARSTWALPRLAEREPVRAVAEMHPHVGTFAFVLAGIDLGEIERRVEAECLNAALPGAVVAAECADGNLVHGSAFRYSGRKEGRHRRG